MTNMFRHPPMLLPRALVAAVLLAAGCAPAGPGSPGATTAPAGAGTGGPSLPSLSNASLDAGHATSRTIGRDGGAIEATDAAGNTYRLSFPKGAVRRATEITVAPLTAVKDIPGDAAVAAGVHLLPEGLALDVAADLVITLAKLPAGGVLPFAYRGDVVAPFRYPTVRTGATVRYSITHFSGYAALASTNAAMDARELGLELTWGTTANDTDAMLSQIASLIDAPSADTSLAITAVLQSWLDTGLAARAAAFQLFAAWDFNGPFRAAASLLHTDLATWDYLSRLLVISGVDVPRALGAAIAATAVPVIVHAVRLVNSSCRSSSTGELLVLRLPEGYGWEELAASMGLTAADPVLADGYLTEHLCVSVVFDPNGGTDFPSGIQPGQSGTLSLRAGIAIDGEAGETRYDAQLGIVIDPRGATDSSPFGGQLDTAGMLSRDFTWATGAAELRLGVYACVPELPACQEAWVIRGGGGATNVFSVLTAIGTAGCTDIQPGCKEWQVESPAGATSWTYSDQRSGGGGSGQGQYGFIEERAPDGSLRSVRIRMSLSAGTSGGGAGRADGTYTLQFRTNAATVGVAGLATLVGRGSTIVGAFTAAEVSIDCGEGVFEADLQASAGAGFPNSASDGRTFAESVDSSEGSCSVEIQVRSGAATNRPAPGESGSADVDLDITITIGSSPAAPAASFPFESGSAG